MYKIKANEPILRKRGYTERHEPTVGRREQNSYDPPKMIYKWDVNSIHIFLFQGNLLKKVTMLYPHKSEQTDPLGWTPSGPFIINIRQVPAGIYSFKVKTIEAPKKCLKSCQY